MGRAHSEVPNAEICVADKSRNTGGRQLHILRTRFRHSAIYSLRRIRRSQTDIFGIHVSFGLLARKGDREYDHIVLALAERVWTLLVFLESFGAESEEVS
jgi:hypothetical protein